MNAPSAADPLMFPCLTCGGSGGTRGGVCTACQGRGKMELVGCPWSFVTSDVWQMLEGIQRRRKQQGWPVAGGWLEQTQVFLDALDLVDELDPEPTAKP